MQQGAKSSGWYLLHRETPIEHVLLLTDRLTESKFVLGGGFNRSMARSRIRTVDIQESGTLTEELT